MDGGGIGLGAVHGDIAGDVLGPPAERSLTTLTKLYRQELGNVL